MLLRLFRAAGSKPCQASKQALDGQTNLILPLFLSTELTKMMIRMTVTEYAPFRCRQGAKQRMVA